MRDHAAAMFPIPTEAAPAGAASDGNSKLVRLLKASLTFSRYAVRSGDRCFLYPLR